jgi:hypothetical protein
MIGQGPVFPVPIHGTDDASMEINEEIEDENARPSRKGPLTAIAILPVFWWLMYGMASGDEPSLRGRRAALKAVMAFFADALGPTGCVVLGLATMAGAAYWLLRTMRQQSEWDEQQRRELIRERQRIIQARNQNQQA